MTAEPPLAPARPDRGVLARAAIIAVAAIFGLTYALTAPLIALNLAERGAGPAFIGANSAMHAVGILITAPFLPVIAARFGLRRLLAAALVASAVLLAAFPAAPWLWLWFPLRLLLGVSAEALFVLSEAWTNELTDDATRARTMAIYTAVMSLGFALGPIVLSLVGASGALPFLIGSALSLVALAVLLLPRMHEPRLEGGGVASPIGYARKAPLAMATMVLYAALEAAGLSFMALYAMSLGWPKSEATRLIATMMVGAICLALPIGWLGDRMDRRRLIVGLALASAVGAALWPLAFAEPVVAYPLVFLWGGLFSGIYTLVLTIVGSRFRGSELVGVYAVMGLAWGLGALVGPTGAGLAIAALPHGLAVFSAAACIAFALFAGWSKSRT